MEAAPFFFPLLLASPLVSQFGGATLRGTPSVWRPSERHSLQQQSDRAIEGVRAGGRGRASADAEAGKQTQFPVGLRRSRSGYFISEV